VRRERPFVHPALQRVHSGFVPRLWVNSRADHPRPRGAYATAHPIKLSTDDVRRLRCPRLPMHRNWPKNAGFSTYEQRVEDAFAAMPNREEPSAESLYGRGVGASRTRQCIDHNVRYWMPATGRRQARKPPGRPLTLLCERIAGLDRERLLPV
jgi:hypothetical protein